MGLFVVTGNGDEDINITSNGRVILFPMPHGNQNMHFPIMAKYWLITKNDTTYQQYDVDKELLDCLEIIYDLIFFLNDIKLALELDEVLVPIIHPPFNPPFNPFKTIGKYC